MTDHPIQVLLVEDNPDIAAGLEKMLVGIRQYPLEGKTGSLAPAFEVHTVFSLSAGLARLETREPDIVLLDLTLPDSQGLDTFRSAYATASGTPIIILTAIDDDSMAVRAVRQGAQDYLIKGQVDANLLARALRHAIERNRADKVIRQRNRELELLNRASQALISSLDLDQVLATFLEEIRRLLEVDICSVWLFDPSTDELVCQQSTGPQNQVVQGWRLGRGEGIAGQVADTGESLIVPDAQSDKRHFVEVDRQLAFSPRSILTAPLRSSTKTIGVLQAMDTQPDRFDQTDLTLLELLAPTAAIAIANAQLYKQVRQDAAELKARNEELDAFAHTVAHDLKNPLTTIISLSELLQEDYGQLPGATEPTRYAHLLGQSGRKMYNIIEALLLLAGVRQMDIDTIVPLKMEDLVDETLQRLDSLAEQYQAEIVAASSWPVALGYGPWIEEVWANYVSNAIKYGGRPPSITLGGRQLDDKTAVFWVKDNGQGISADAQNRLFTPFTRLDQASTKGHGLGLSIVRRIVEKMGGQVGVDSQEGQGSTFYFTLPTRIT